MPKVMVEEDCPLYVPEWVLRARAQKRLAQALIEHHKSPNGAISPEQVAQMADHHRVPGIVQVNPTGKGRDFLFVPSFGMLEAAEVKDIVGRMTVGGYGKPIVHRSDSISRADWHSMVNNMVDELVERRLKAAKGRIVYGT